MLTALITLALLQYQWIGQVAEVERVRLDRDLRRATDRFVGDFNEELERLALTLTAGRGRNNNYSTGMEERLALWRQSTSYPGLVRNVYLTNDSEIPSYLSDLAGRLPQPVDFVAARGRGRPPVVVDSDIPAIAIPVVFSEDTIDSVGELREAVDSLIVEFDLEYIRTTWLPELVASHYGDSYHVEVIGGGGAGQVIYKSDQDASLQDASTPVNDAGVGRLFALRSIQNGRGRGADRFGGGRGGEVRFGPPQDPPPGAPPPPGAAPPLGGPPPEEEPPQFIRAGWRVQANHRAGPLGQVVSDFRTRNLAISFGMLLLMGVSVAMLMLSSRKSRLLAGQQMEFVAGVTHELRTPLAVIQSASQNLADGVASSEAQIKRYGNVIRDHSHRLTSMVEQILRFAGLASGRVEIQHEHVDVGAVVAQAVHDCGPELAAAGSQVETRVSGDLPTVDGDPEALVHCLRNLLVNAAKHGEGSPVVVSTGLAAGDANTIEIRVTDHGPGIDPADQPYVFEPFYRGRRATSNQVQGSGLGLSLVKKIVEAHGGQVRLMSRFGEARPTGTTFTLRLPVEAAGSGPDSASGVS